MDYLKLAQEAFEASTTYIDGNFRSDWDYSLRAFRNEHASGSKYLSEEYKARSRIFYPKTRSVIRKNEAAGMHAMFANRETVNVTPGNPDDVMSVAGAACMKEVLEYRLSRTIPAFEIYLGGLQDAQTTGAVVSYQYWDYQKRPDGRVVKDKPCIELRPIENIRIDAGASWLDTVESTPYLCDIIPMYVCDVRAMMVNKDEKTGRPKWKTLDDNQILQSRPDMMDATRRARLGEVQDPHEETHPLKSFDVVWVLRWFMRDSQSEDQTFYTLGTEDLLCDAKPIEEVYFHGKRPYVMGYAVLETHKAFKPGIPVLTRPLQQATNNLGNARFDNVQFVLYKRWLVARGRQVDVQSLVRGVPGGVTLMTDPKTDVQESNWPDVTSSAFVEQDRLHSAFDDLAGNFSPATKVANNAVNDTLGGSKMASAGAGMMTDYLITTVNKTWWDRVLGQLTLLEAYYETDNVVLGICANKANLFPRFGMSQITDDLLMQQVSVSADAALGDPQQRFQKFMMASQAVIQLNATAPPGMNVKEMAKEIWANAGYRDGERFQNQQVDPRLIQAAQTIKQLQGALEGKQMEIQAGQQTEAAKLQSNERIKGAQLQVDQSRIQGDLQIRQAELAIEQQRVELERLKVQIEAEGASQDIQLRAAEIQPRIEEAQAKLEIERTKLAGQQEKTRQEMVKGQLELLTIEAEHDTAETSKRNESRIGEVATEVTQAMSGIATEIKAIQSSLADAKTGMDAHKSDIDGLRQGLGAMAGVVMMPKRKATGFTLKKNGKKTVGVTISHDDGSVEEMAVK